MKAAIYTEPDRPIHVHTRYSRLFCESTVVAFSNAIFKHKLSSTHYMI